MLALGVALSPLPGGDDDSLRYQSYEQDSLLHGYKASQSIRKWIQLGELVR